MPNVFLEIQQLSAVVSDQPLFAPISLHAAASDIIHIKGCNGSGKTTLLRCISGLHKDYTGAVISSAGIIYCGHKLPLQGTLTVQETLKEWVLLYGIQNDYNPDIVSYLALPDHQDVRTGNLSQGQRQRLDLARLLYSDAKIWLLDEPLSSLDAAGQDLMAGLIQAFATKGGIVMLTSHQTVPFANQSFIIEPAQTRTPTMDIW